MVHPTRKKGTLGFDFHRKYPYSLYFIVRGLAGKKHQAWDILCPVGTPVVAPTKMQQSRADWSPSYGNVVYAGSLDPKFKGLEFRFAHLSVIAFPRVGKIIKEDEVFAWSGSTGISTAPHLHWEVLKNGIKVDPKLYL